MFASRPRSRQATWIAQGRSSTLWIQTWFWRSFAPPFVGRGLGLTGAARLGICELLFHACKVPLVVRLVLAPFLVGSHGLGRHVRCGAEALLDRNAVLVLLVIVAEN